MRRARPRPRMVELRPPAGSTASQSRPAAPRRRTVPAQYSSSPAARRCQSLAASGCKYIDCTHPVSSNSWTTVQSPTSQQSLRMGAVSIPQGWTRPLVQSPVQSTYQGSARERLRATTSFFDCQIPNGRRPSRWHESRCLSRLGSLSNYLLQIALTGGSYIFLLTWGDEGGGGVGVETFRCCVNTTTRCWSSHDCCRCW